MLACKSVCGVWRICWSMGMQNEECEMRVDACQMKLVCMGLNMCVVQPVPYEPCHGRPDSQPARPRLPQGCESRTLSSPSAGAPLPPRIPDLSQTMKVNSVVLVLCATNNRKTEVFCTHVCSHR